ncbi:MAG: hypothetical protein F4093_00170, partial [Gammaproteobacteria bacterium]|nr:hypothetical protein [Gammaproteobacteria bacterium]
MAVESVPKRPGRLAVPGDDAAHDRNVEPALWRGLRRDRFVPQKARDGNIRPRVLDLYSNKPGRHIRFLEPPAHHTGRMERRDMKRESFATRYAERVLAARWPVILITLCLVAMASSGITRLEFSANYRIFFDEDNPQLLALEALENTYGKNENIVFLIVPKDGDATSKEALSAAVWLTDAAWHTPYSRRVDSLANFQHTTADGDDLYVRDLVDPQALDSAEVRSRIRAIALSDPRIEGSILARNGDVSVVNITVELPEEGLLDAVAEVAEFARSVAAQAEERFPGIDLRIVGTTMINQTFLEASINSQKIF